MLDSLTHALKPIIIRSNRSSNTRFRPIWHILTHMQQQMHYIRRHIQPLNFNMIIIHATLIIPSLKF